MKPPPIRFADSREGKIAYQVVGDGPIDVLFVPGWGGFNLDAQWEHAPLERFMRRLSSFCRLVLVNLRGLGLSDPIPLGTPPSIEEWTSDFRWVLDAIGSERAAVLTIDMPGACALFSATHPDRVSALALVNAPARLRRADDYPWGLPPAAMDAFIAYVIDAWGKGELLTAFAPETAKDERFHEWYARLERLTASPGAIEAAFRWAMEIDVRSVLSSIKAPTLVVSHAGHTWVRPEHSRYLAQHISGARYVERPGFFGLYWLHDVEWLLDEVQTFFTGTKGGPSGDDRVLATVLFTDMVNSTSHAAEMGDERWRWLLDEYEEATRREIERFRGHAVKSTGDGFLVTFDGPARAIRCAAALRDTAGRLGVDIRAGLHTGEVEIREEDVGGIAIHIAARVMAEAGPREVLVSGSVPPLVAGSGIAFEDHGEHELKGVPGSWQLFKADV